LLADDMGLGKTVMTIAFCAAEKSHKRLKQGCLIIAPRSMLGVWQKEFQRFAPSLSVYAYHGSKRDPAELTQHDIICTTYAIATRDAHHIGPVRFDMIVCDEAQALKNPATKATKILKTFTGDWRLALTGTPMENHLGELWSLMRWLNASLLGSEKHFSTIFRKPIEKEADQIAGARLRSRIAPVLLRRSKDVVAQDLPEKTQTTVIVEMGKKQRELYESIRVAMDDRLRSAIASKGLAKSGLLLLEALLRLRQVCCDPSLIKTETAQAVDESAKIDALRDMLPTLVEDGRRILIFSQFTGMLQRIEQLCAELNITCGKLTGQTQKRQELIDDFQDEKFPVFLISLKAGGTGLTLTAADTIIHFDPWWNPAVEDQATDRAHRIGQTKPVFVYRFITAGSVEERISTLQERKRELAASIYGKDGQVTAQLSEDDVAELFRPLG
ncbi:MAG: DEAD/DEAH box helicase, partial [Planctomycetes bacterium]|nr:DEAD/DEAH box helicase [Planctomycetota bacterium]